MRSLAFSAVLLAVAVACGCGTKEDVSLTVSTQGETLAVGMGPFGQKLTGTVDVFFDLGAYSGDPVHVETIHIGLYRGTTQIVPGVQFDPDASTTFPFDVAPGERRTVHYTIHKDQLLADEASSICAGPITITGTVTQTGRGPLQITGYAVTATGC